MADVVASHDYTEHASNLNYTEMGQRVYNPATGRFQQTDPIEGGSANNYDYVNADPTNSYDLNGTRPVTLKKGQKLSCGRGYYAYSYTTYNGTYWDCASKAGKKAKEKNGKALIGVVDYILGGSCYISLAAKVLCRAALCGAAVGLVGGIAQYRP